MKVLLKFFMAKYSINHNVNMKGTEREADPVPPETEQKRRLAATAVP